MFAGNIADRAGRFYAGGVAGQSMAGDTPKIGPDGKPFGHNPLAPWNWGPGRRWPSRARRDEEEPEAFALSPCYACYPLWQRTR